MTSLWDRVKAFLKRAGTIIFALAVVLWGLVSWPQPPAGATGAAIDYSLAGTLGHAIQPLFAPLGFTWEMCIAMIPGIAAREVSRCRFWVPFTPLARRLKMRYKTL